MESTVIPIAAATAVLGPYWTTPVGFAFIDAAHDDAGVALDAATWAPHIRSGGIIAFHDTTIPGIASAFTSLDDFEFLAELDTLMMARLR